jgi:hypothetical protein
MPNCSNSSKLSATQLLLSPNRAQPLNRHNLRVLKQHLERQVGKPRLQVVMWLTDLSKGALRKLADSEGYRYFCHSR